MHIVIALIGVAIIVTGLVLAFSGSIVIGLPSLPRAWEEQRKLLGFGK